MIEKITEEGEEFCPCRKCDDSNCKDGCSYYMKYLSADTPENAKNLFYAAVEDFKNLPMLDLLRKKRKVPLNIAESHRISRSRNKDQPCHNRNLGL